MSDKKHILARIADALERLAPETVPATDWLAHPRLCLERRRRTRASRRSKRPRLDLLRGIDAQKAAVTGNVARLAQGHAAHDMLLWGSRGMGKSALLRAAVLAAQDTRPGRIALVQVGTDALDGLALLFAELGKVGAQLPRLHRRSRLRRRRRRRPAPFAQLARGRRRGAPANVRLAVTSNRRAIVARQSSEQDDPLNPRDVVDDRLALADRFGLSLGFHNCSQGDYLAIVGAYADRIRARLGGGRARSNGRSGGERVRAARRGSSLPNSPAGPASSSRRYCSTRWPIAGAPGCAGSKPSSERFSLTIRFGRALGSGTGRLTRHTIRAGVVAHQQRPALVPCYPGRAALGRAVIIEEAAQQRKPACRSGLPRLSKAT